MIYRTAVVLIAVLMLSGCGPFASRSLPTGVNKSSVAGIWVHDADDSSSGAALEFQHDGTFTYEGLPAEIVDSEHWVMGQEYNELIAQSQDLRDGDGTWEIHDSEIMMDFGGSLTWAHPTGFLSFRGIEFTCDMDHAGSYVLDRAE